MRNSLKALDGVYKVDVDLDEKTAIIVYEAAKLAIADLTEATTGIGFPSTVKNDNE